MAVPVPSAPDTQSAGVLPLSVASTVRRTPAPEDPALSTCARKITHHFRPGRAASPAT